MYTYILTHIGSTFKASKVEAQEEELATVWADAMSWQIDFRAACRKLQRNDAPDISIANDGYGAELEEQKSQSSCMWEGEATYMSNTTIPCVLNGRASLLATVPATTLAGIIAADTLAQPSILILTHAHTQTHAHTTKEIAHFKRFEFVKGYFSHYNKKWGWGRAPHVMTTPPLQPALASCRCHFQLLSVSLPLSVPLAATFKCRTAEKSYKHK